MNNTQSKVLILENSDEHRDAIKEFCVANNLIALTSRVDDPLTVLKSYVDLGAVFISESHNLSGKAGLELAADIHYFRPELPIFFRCSKETLQKYQNIFLNHGICFAYEISDIHQLEKELNSNIFNQSYPNELLRGIEEIANNTLQSFFTECDIEYSAPYLVKDRIIFGELFSLIPMESNWCKGYMMLQSNQQNLLKLVDSSKLSSIHSDDFRTVNDVLSELTNMIWGGIKARFIREGETQLIAPTQIPIIVNHSNEYITFGTNAPHLCFRYTIKSKSDTSTTLSIFHKFIFNVNWAPEHFKDAETNVDSYLDSGMLEFF